MSGVGLLGLLGQPLRALDQWHQALVQHVVGGVIGVGDGALAPLHADAHAPSGDDLADRLARRAHGVLEGVAHVLQRQLAHRTATGADARRGAREALLLRMRQRAACQASLNSWVSQA